MIEFECTDGKKYEAPDDLVSALYAVSNAFPGAHVKKLILPNNKHVGVVHVYKDGKKARRNIPRGR